MSFFWHIVFPTLMLLLLLFVLFVVYTMPDWALDCKAGLAPLRSIVKTAATESAPLHGILKPTAPIANLKVNNGV